MKHTIAILFLIFSFNANGINIHTTSLERSNIYQSGRISRYTEMDSGKLIGFRVFEVKEEGLYNQMGLNVGDVIVGVNNIYFPELTMNNFNKLLRESDSLLLHVRRKLFFINVIKNIEIQFIYEN